MHRSRPTARSLIGFAAGVSLLAGSSGLAGAAHETGPELDCGGEHYVLRPDAGRWSASKLEGTNTKYIPVRHSITAHTSAGHVYGPFLSEKGGGNAHANQETVECTFSSIHHAVEDPFGGGIVDVTFTVVVEAVAKP